MGSGDLFVTTRWSQVLAAQGANTQAGAALGDLCAAYYAPVHAYIARTAHDLGEPRDLTHDFFARILAGSMLGGADRMKGRFRAFLLGAVKHFLADTRDRRAAAKRGAQHEHVALYPGTETSPGIAIAAPDALSDAWFDREWGVAVLDRALAVLVAEYAPQGKAEYFQTLKPWLTGDGCADIQAAAATRLGMTEGALKVAIHRLRKRFRDLVKAEIAQTVSTEAEVREELRFLIAAVN